MSELKTIAEHRCFGGVQGFYEHAAESTGTAMRFAVFRPPQALDGAAVPVLWFLSGLTCTEENFTVKAGAQRYAAEHGVMLVAPDTSPRGAGIPGEDDSYDFGSGAGFYVDATTVPWNRHYRMYSYISKELPRLVLEHFPAHEQAQGICGHSMGGHGALVMALRNPGRYRSVSAFAPICAPGRVAWGRKALGGYLGPDEAAWRAYDSVALIEDGARCAPILVDQGEADDFLADQLRPDLLQAACKDADQALTLRMHAGYDHSYFFIASLIGDHLRWHSEVLNAL